MRLSIFNMGLEPVTLEINDMDKGGYSSKCKIAPVELLPLMATYRPTVHYLNISVKSDHN